MSQKVIIAVTTYNAGRALLNLAKQIDSQDFDEVYILDDCSTDRSIEKLEKAYPNFNIIKGEENKGPGGNRNRLLDVIES